MQFVICLIGICLIVSLVSAGFKIRFYQLMPVCAIAAIAILYVSYIFGDAKIGLAATGLCFIGLIGLALYRISKWNWDKGAFKEFIVDIFNPQLVILILAIIVNYFITRDHFVKLMDELHLWAMLPKLIYYNNGTFQQSADSLLAGFRDYIPGMPLWSWFCEVLNGSFADNVLFCGYCSLGNIFLIAGLRNITWKKWYLMIPGAFIVIFSPQMFFNTIFNDSVIWFKAIHVDMIMGVALAMALYLIYIHWWENKIDTVLFVSILVFNILIKSSGIGMVLILVIASILSIGIKVCIRGNKIHIFFATCIPIAFWLSWNTVLKVYDIPITVPFKPMDMFNAAFFRNFVSELINVPVVRFNNVNTGFFATLPVVILLLIFLIGCGYTRKERRRDLSIVSATWITMTVVFLLGLYIVYCWYAERIATVQSYPRYISTMLTAIWIFWLYMMLESISEFMGQKLWRKLYTAITVLVCFVVFPHTYPLGIMYPSMAYDHAAWCANQIIEQIGTGRGMLVLADNYDDYVPSSQEYFYKRLRYNLIGINDLDMCFSYLKGSDMKIQDNKIVLSGIEIFNPESIDWVSAFLIDSQGQAQFTVYNVKYIGNESFKIL